MNAGKVFGIGFHKTGTKSLARAIESAIRYFGDTTSPIRRWIYGAHAGSPIGHERHYIERYERHNAEALDFFAGRPDCLLVLRVTGGEGWSPLCEFLGREIPSREFPCVAPVSKRQ